MGNKISSLLSSKDQNNIIDENLSLDIINKNTSSNTTDVCVSSDINDKNTSSNNIYYDIDNTNK